MEKELRAYLSCGDPSRGFIRLFCDRCQHEHVLPFSCKGRAICPSCCARRTAAAAVHLVDEVLPDVPIRQYVLSPPFDLRGLLASRSGVFSKMSQIFVRAIFRRMKRWAKSRGLDRPQCGSVTSLQRFTKTLSISPHLHVLVLDGVFVNDDDGESLRFIDCPPPTECDLLDLAQEVLEKMTRFLKKEGYLEQAEENLNASDRWFLRGVAEPSMLTATRVVGSALEYGGFSIHANVTVARGDKRGREQICRYVTRPGFAEDQLRLTPDGRVELTLRKPAKNGQRVVLLEPLAFLRRIAWLVPPPRQHQLRYAGILAPAAKHRREVVPRPPPQIQLAFALDNARPERQTFRPSWAKLIARVYALDAERCPRCGGPLRPIGAVTDPTEALRHLARFPSHGARDPPQLSLAL